MSRIYVTSSSLKALLGDVQQWSKKTERDAIKAMTSVGIDIAGDVQKEIGKGDRNSVDTGALQASVKSTAGFLAGSAIATKIYSDKEYSSVVEFGRRPNKTPPPLAVLVGWAARKKITKKVPVTADLDQEPYRSKLRAAYAIMKRSKSGGGSGKKSKAKNTKIDPMVSDFCLLIAIQRSIGKKGIKGKGIFTKIRDRRMLKLTYDFLKHYNLLL